MELNLFLSRPGMSALHKAGLAGLYMTLRALEKSKFKIEGFQFELSPKAVNLSFPEDAVEDTIDKLVRFGFQTDESGFIVLPGLSIGGGQSFENKLLTHESVLNTFYQFGPHRKSSVELRNFSGDNDRPIIKPNFRAVSSFVAQNSASSFVRAKKLAEKIEVISWMYPGGTEKHAGLSGTSLYEPSGTALPLLFAPVGVVYVPVRAFHSASASKIRVCILLSDITNLEEYAEIRAEIAGLSELKLVMSGASEALLFLAERFKIRRSQGVSELPLVTSIAMGSLVWVGGGQKVRTAVRSLRTSDPGILRNYEIICAALKNQVVIREAKVKKGKDRPPDTSFISVPSSRGLFAENIVNGRYFYSEISDIFIPHQDQSGNLRYRISYEREGLSNMIEKIEFATPGERIFIEAFHEAWRRHLGQLGAQSKLEGSSFKNRATRDFERLRSSLARSKNADSVRETITEFWARSGSIPALRDNWEKVIPLFSFENWKKARDLGLLALASYKPQEKHESEAMDSIALVHEEEENDE